MKNLTTILSTAAFSLSVLASSAAFASSGAASEVTPDHWKGAPAGQNIGDENACGGGEAKPDEAKTGDEKKCGGDEKKCGGEKKDEAADTKDGAKKDGAEAACGKGSCG